MKKGNGLADSCMKIKEGKRNAGKEENKRKVIQNY